MNRSTDKAGPGRRDRPAKPGPGHPVDLTEIEIRTALVRSGIPGVDYAVNPYLGCGHGCLYCYASFMTRYSRRHAGARWGTFVEAKGNIAGVLRSELARKRKRGTVLLSSVCDPYQPAEVRYRLTRRCLEALREAGWGFDILTRSPLVTRDVDLLAPAGGVSVGLTVPTDDDGVRKILEPNAPPIAGRIAALKKLHEAAVDTWAFIGPMLPMNPKGLYEALNPFVNRVLIDGLHYRSKVAGLFERLNWGYALTDRYALETERELRRLFGEKAESV